MEALPVVIIANPNSTGDSVANAQDLAVDLKDLSPQRDVRISETTHAGHAKELTEAAGRQYRGQVIVVSSSGDGGYNEVVNGAMTLASQRMAPICAVLASGNANDHRKAMARRPLAQALSAPEPRLMDVLELTTKANGVTTTRYAHSYIGFGLTPAVALELSRHRLSSIPEALLLRKAFQEFRPLEIKSGDMRLAFDSIIASNIGGMAKVFKLAQNSIIDDGLFELNIFPHGYKRQLFYRLLQGATVGLKPTRRTDRFEFTSARKLLAQCDGEVTEIMAGSRVVITSNARALRYAS